jgi:DNA-binding transcriptional LysR family regulator
VSHAVSKVEKKLAATILNRTTRRIGLMNEGQQFVESVRAGLLHINKAEESLISRGELPASRLCIDAAIPFVFHRLVPLIQRLKKPSLICNWNLPLMKVL